VSKKEKSLSLTYLKKSAPKVPDFTCVSIDNVINKLEKIVENNKKLIKIFYRMVGNTCFAYR